MLVGVGLSLLERKKRKRPKSAEKRAKVLSFHSSAFFASLVVVVVCCVLNVFVVVSLLTGVSSARDKVLTASAAMLGISSIMTGVYHPATRCSAR